MQEDHLIRACILGDRVSQTKLYEIFAPRMLGLCLRYARNREEAEDILHEGFLRVFKYLKKFRGHGSLEGWIRRIMINCALFRYRNNSCIQPVIQLKDADSYVGYNSDIQSDLNAKELLALVQSLPAGYRMVFNLYVFEGYKHKEIAELLGISVGTSKSNLYDARVFLQQALTPKRELMYYSK